MAKSTNGGSTYTNIINSGIYSGATSASLNLTGLHQLKTVMTIEL
jgi:hypothetical protein